MIVKDLDGILAELDGARARKRDIQLIQAQDEIKAINREYNAYHDGCCDALRMVRNAIEKERKGSNTNEIG